MNDTLSEWLEYDAGEAVLRQMNLEDMLYASDGSQPEELTRQPYSGELKFTRKNGSLLHVNVEQHIIQDDDGSMLAVAGLVSKV